jgi:hypothetical protein
MSVDKIICPKCGAGNVFDSNYCTSCGLSVAHTPDEVNQPTPKQKDSASSVPAMPKLPVFPNMELGNLVDARTALLDTVGMRAGEVRARFCIKLAEMKIKVGTGIIDNQNFLFVYFPASGLQSYTIIAVRIEAQENKLLIERRRYVKVKRTLGLAAWVWIILFAIISQGLTLFFLLIKGYREFLFQLDGSPEEAHVLTSQTHEVTVLSVLMDAVKASGGLDARMSLL